MIEIKAFIRPHKLDAVLQALHAHPELPGVTISHARGFGRKVGRESMDSSDSDDFANTPMVKLESVVSKDMSAAVVDVIEKAAYTGRPGDGKIFTSKVDECVRISSGERGKYAL